MFSCIAFRRACQIAQSVTPTLVVSSCVIARNKADSQALACGSCTLQTKSVDSSGANAQTHFAILHSTREWNHESSSPQMPHVLTADIFRCFRTSFVGKDWRARRHRKTLILDGTCTCHSLVHSFSEARVSEEPALFSIHVVRFSRVLTSIWYAERTENTPRRS